MQAAGTHLAGRSRLRRLRRTVDTEVRRLVPMTEPLVGLAYVGMLFSPVLVSLFGFKPEAETVKLAPDGNEALTIIPVRVPSEGVLAGRRPESVAVLSSGGGDRTVPIQVERGATVEVRERSKLQPRRHERGFNPGPIGRLSQVGV
jgi:hypothetical protein